MTNNIYAVWWTYFSNFGEPLVIQATDPQDAIDLYPTMYEKSAMTWHVFPMKGLEGFKRAPLEEKPTVFNDGYWKRGKRGGMVEVSIPTSIILQST